MSGDPAGIDRPSNEENPMTEELSTTLLNDEGQEYVPLALPGAG